jgi:SAM-dependent methyltransferase
MLAEARRLDAGAHPNIRWTAGRAEDAPLGGPYDLAVAGAAIHWMDPAVLMPRLAMALVSDASLALVEGDGPGEADWKDAYQAVIVRWVEKAGRRWNDQAHQALVAAHRPWFDELGAETFTAEVRQPVEALIEGEHSRATWARRRMGAAAAAFDAELRAVLAPYATEGVVAYRTRTVLTWGRPRTRPRG